MQGCYILQQTLDCVPNLAYFSLIIMVSNEIFDDQ